MKSEFSAQNLKTRRIHRAVEVSAQLFLRDGIEAVKMTDIADESGIGVATLYRYFGTKTGIAIAAMTHLWEELKRMFSGVFDSDVFKSQPGIKQVGDLMRMFIVLYEAHPAFMRLLVEFEVTASHSDGLLFFCTVAHRHRVNPLCAQLSEGRIIPFYTLYYIRRAG